MKATELRIGTWYKDIDNGKEYQIKSWDECSLAAVRGEPIPLTTEWLEKFGFKFFKTVGGLYRCEKGDFRLLDMKLLPLSNKRVDYVHQLQNLYHALTGEEL